MLGKKKLHHNYLIYYAHNIKNKLGSGLLVFPFPFLSLFFVSTLNEQQKTFANVCSNPISETGTIRYESKER